MASIHLDEELSNSEVEGWRNIAKDLGLFRELAAILGPPSVHACDGPSLLFNLKEFCDSAHHLIRMRVPPQFQKHLSFKLVLKARSLAGVDNRAHSLSGSSNDQSHYSSRLLYVKKLCMFLATSSGASSGI